MSASRYRANRVSSRPALLAMNSAGVSSIQVLKGEIAQQLYQLGVVGDGVNERLLMVAPP